MRLKAYTIPISLGAAFLMLGLLRLTDLSLYTDSTRYLLWANSLARFSGFVDGSLPEPSHFVMNAPLYSILLSPSQLLFSMSALSAKVWTLLFGALSVGLLFLWLRRSFSMTLAIGGTVFFALNPMMLVMSTEILSEAPFIATWLAILILMERQLSSEAKWQKEILLLFTLLALTVLLREVALGIVIAASLHFYSKKEYKYAAGTIIPTLLLYLLWVYRGLSVGDSGSAGQSSNVQYIFQHFTTPADAFLLNEFVGRLLLNLDSYVIEIGAILFYPFPDLTAEPSSILQAFVSFLFGNRLILLTLLAPLIVFGMVLDVRHSPSGFFRILSVAFFFMILLFYPVHDLRFLLPLLPLALFFVLRVLSWISVRLTLSRPKRIALAVISSTLFVFPNLLSDIEMIGTTITYRNDPLGFSSRYQESTTIPKYYRRVWSEAGRWISDSIPAGSVLLSPAKEIAPFVEQQKVLEVSRTVPTPAFERLMRDYDVGYLLTYTLWGNLRAYEFQMNESRRFWFEQIHTIGDIAVFRIHRLNGKPNPRPQEGPPLAANPGAADYFRFGRYDFMNLRYSQAILGFTLARNEQPREPEPYYSLLVVHAAISDTAAALQAFQSLSSLPESTPYIPLAQAHLNLARLLRGASEARNQNVQSSMATNASIACWNLGYPRLALRIVSNVIKLDSTFFDARLWASHFARQLGDTLLAYRHLRALEGIDRSAPIVGDFLRVKMYEDSLRRTRSTAKKADYHRALAIEYSGLEFS